jgi:predicted transcriptional regulator
MADSTPTFQHLSRREQQILSSIYARKSATTHEVLSDIPDQPGYSSIRKIMQIMVEKGLLTYRRAGLTYVYEAVNEVSKTQQSALTRLVQSLFNSSPSAVVATMLEAKDLDISASELEQMKELISRKSAEIKHQKKS